MLLPSGPANTRCSACRFDPGGLHVQLRLAPGTGLQSRETGSQNRRYRDLSRRQRPHLRIRTRGNARKLRAIRQRPGNIGSHRTAWWWMQPGSNLSPPQNSLLAGNLAGNFLKKGPRRAILVSKTRAASSIYNQIPCSTEQGIFLHEQGILSREQGILRLGGKRPLFARLFCACRTRSVLTGLFCR
jgi:hypothetical protein